MKLYLLWQDFDREGDMLLGVFETSEERDKLKEFLINQVDVVNQISDYEFKETEVETGELVPYFETHQVAIAWAYKKGKT